MVQTFEDMLADQPSSTAKVYVWVRAMSNLPITIVNQYIEVGGSLMNLMPNYAKRGMLAGAFLLVPFFVLVAANVIQPFAGVWKDIGYFGVFILPVVALLIGGVTLIALIASKKFTLRIKSLLQPASWGVLAVPVLALLIVGFAFGHDRVQCAAKGNPDQIVECIGRE
ncbi:MAG TPA: hypothetical protein VLH38_05575 [Patescibacteria group bacterium]|nr:hypothetical protein [Patescibacteria group bacterium]